MIKVRPIHMDYDRVPNLNNPNNTRKDKSWFDTIKFFFLPNMELIWKDIELSMDDDPDYYIVFGSLYKYKDNSGRKIDYFDESKAVLFHVEPLALRQNFKANGYNANNFGSNFLKTFNILPLWTGCGMTYNQQLETTIDKTKTMSAIISSTQSTSGHMKRLGFLRNYLSRMNVDHYGHQLSGVGLFSNSPFNKNYRGYSANKSIALLPYKYNFSVENSQEIDYITEKMLEAIVSECLTFYSGAPNVDSYINPDAFIKLNLNNPEHCYQIIQDAIANEEWEKRINVIKETKHKIVTELNLMNLTYNAINKVQNYFE